MTPPSAAIAASRSSCSIAERALLGTLALTALIASSACDREVSGEIRLTRADRYGVFADLVLFPSLSIGGSPFFLDRFETTQADWRAYRLAQGLSLGEIDAELQRRGSDVDPAIPVTMIYLAEARRYAAWRFGRLPRYAEWYAASTGGDRYLMPWGNQTKPWANSLELGLGFLTPVGTFESGRLGNGPYDLIGNAAEWTESVDRGRLSGQRGQWMVAENLGLAIWCRQPLPVPAFWVLAGGEAMHSPAERIVVGGHNLSMNSPAQRWRLSGGKGRSSQVGLRLAADPEGIVVALLAETERPSAVEERALRRFLSKPEHRRVLRQACLRRPSLLAASGPLAQILLGELDL